MGTNYYQIIKPCEHCGRGEEEIHIGKSSGGWPFAVHVIPDEGLYNWSDWKKRLKDSEIFDEYGCEISLEELDALVIEKRKHKSDIHVLAEYKQYPSHVGACETGDRLISGEFS